MEKRVKSRFSHRIWRVQSPLSPDGPGWRPLIRRVLVPWLDEKKTQEDKETRKWKVDWQFAIGVSSGVYAYG